jgi:hypothetical protein
MTLINTYKHMTKRSYTHIKMVLIQCPTCTKSHYTEKTSREHTISIDVDYGAAILKYSYNKYQCIHCCTSWHLINLPVGYTPQKTDDNRYTIDLKSVEYTKNLIWRDVVVIDGNVLLSKPESAEPVHTDTKRKKVLNHCILS